MPTDFTLAAFAGLCQRAARTRVLPVADFLRTAPCVPFVILRFDVDYREAFAVRLAQMLAAERLRGTFYFRHHADGFDWAAIDMVAALGHEVGYHYETLDRSGGDFLAAGDRFLADISALRAHGVEVGTVAAHGAPPVSDTYAGNLDLLRADPSLLSQASLRGDAVASVDFGRLTYFSDAGWRWQRRNGAPPDAAVAPCSFADVLEQVAEPSPANYINIHPQQWFARPANTRYFRWRNRVGMRVVPRLRAIRRAATAPGAAASPRQPGTRSSPPGHGGS